MRYTGQVVEVNPEEYDTFRDNIDKGIYFAMDFIWPLVEIQGEMDLITRQRLIVDETIAQVPVELQQKAKAWLAENIKEVNSLKRRLKVNPRNYVSKYKYLKEGKLYEAAMACPTATQNLELNTKNRDAAIKAEYIQYGPLNVDEPGDYWKDIAEYWNTTEEAAKKSLCGNCVAFDISPRMDECMPGETSDKDGRLGYCWMHHFKCHSARSCRTWAKGGPITKDSVSYDWQERNKDKV